MLMHPCWGRRAPSPLFQSWSCSAREHQDLIWQNTENKKKWELVFRADKIENREPYPNSSAKKYKNYVTHFSRIQYQYLVL